MDLYWPVARQQDETPLHDAGFVRRHDPQETYGVHEKGRSAIRAARKPRLDRGATGAGPITALPAPAGCNPGRDRLPRRAYHPRSTTPVRAYHGRSDDGTQGGSLKRRRPRPAGPQNASEAVSAAPQSLHMIAITQGRCGPRARAWVMAPFLPFRRYVVRCCPRRQSTAPTKLVSGRASTESELAVALGELLMDALSRLPSAARLTASPNRKTPGNTVEPR